MEDILCERLGTNFVSLSSVVASGLGSPRTLIVLLLLNLLGWLHLIETTYA